MRERLNQLQELHILPEHRAQPDPDSDGETESAELAKTRVRRCPRSNDGPFETVSTVPMAGLEALKTQEGPLLDSGPVIEKPEICVCSWFWKQFTC
jgi:hypothetical protein